MAERPPPGYDKSDKPLPHNFGYRFGMDISDETKNGTIVTYLKTTVDSVDPKTIEVNNRNSSFADDRGPVICYDSIVNQMTIDKTFVLTEHMINTDRLQALVVKTAKLMGCWQDTYTPADELTTTTIAQLTELTSDLTKEDVTPAFSGVDMTSGAGQPLSTVVFPTDAIANWDLTTANVLESVPIDWDTLFNAFQFYTNGGKLKTLLGKIKNKYLWTEARVIKDFEKRLVPKTCRTGQPHMYMGEMIDAPLYNTNNQISGPSTTATAGSHVDCMINVRFNEWNPEFDQSRM